MLTTKVFKTSAVVATLALGTACGGPKPVPVEKPPVVVEAPKKVELSPADKLGAANQTFAKGDYKGAANAYEAIVAAEPSNDTAAFNHAVALQKAGDVAGAKKAYQAILAKDPNDVEAALNLGAIYKDEGKVDDGIALYTKVLKGDEYNSRVLNNLAALYRVKKNYAKSVDTLRKLLMRDQRNVDAYKNLALAYYEQKKFKLAQTILGNAQKMAEKAGKKDPDIFVNVGMIQIALGDNGKAMAAFKQAVELDPKHVVANYNIGSLALAHRDYDLAAASYSVVAAAWPESYEITASLGYALQGQQKLEDAAKMLEKARTIKATEGMAQADEEQIVYQLWQIYQTANNAKSALKFADEYLKLKNKTCKETDTDDVCGRYMGTVTMVKMEAQGQAQPAQPEKKKAAGTGKDIFTDAPPPPDDGTTPPPEGQQAPTEGAAPAGTETKPGEPAPAGTDPAPQGGAEKPAEPKK